MKTTNFHLVYKPENWQSHDQNKQQSLKQQLKESHQQADAREFETAAERFQPSPQLLNAINAAIAARVPLLLTGEPGTGKTQVAWFLKRFFDIKLFEYQVRSNSQANDLRYDFDAVAYLRDAYLAKPQQNDDDENDKRSDPKYLKQGPLWQAYEHKDDSILLIDEIDKAPRDFPNDLLQELDQHRFAHPFKPKEFVQRQTNPPLIIITSNGERRLPDAFLRRCIVHHIELNNALLSDIMTAWNMQFPNLDEATRQQALTRFQEIRKLSRLSKKPGAAELLLWLSILSAQAVKREQLEKDVSLSDLPALICLIKDHADYQYL